MKSNQRIPQYRQQQQQYPNPQSATFADPTMADDDCLGRIPFASIIASVLCWIGVTMFCFMMAQAVNASIEQARRALRIENLPWLDKVFID